MTQSELADRLVEVFDREPRVRQKIDEIAVGGNA
jgi:hypothetical protein